MRRKLVLPIILLVAVLILSGCYETETTFDIQEDGMASVKMVAQADKIMAGDEINTVMWGLMNSFPELKNNYNVKKETITKNYSDYLVYTFESKENFNIDDIENIEYKNEDGSYKFIMDIPSLVSEVTEDNKNDVMFTIKVNMPKEIDMANSSSYKGKTVTWKVAREQLLEGLTLKAYTK